LNDTVTIKSDGGIKITMKIVVLESVRCNKLSCNTAPIATAKNGNFILFLSTVSHGCNSSKMIE